MYRSGYGLPELISDLGVIIADAADEWEILDQARPLAEWIAQEPENWLGRLRFGTRSTSGFGAIPLHEDPQGGLTVCAVTWPPGGYIAPHEHLTWEIVTAVFGTMRHTCWGASGARTKSAGETLGKTCEFLLLPGQAASVMPRETHGLENIGGSPGLTIHIYGCKLGQAERCRADVELPAMPTPAGDQGPANLKTRP